MERSGPALRALTPEAEAALGGVSEVAVDPVPFRVGREARDDETWSPFGLPERRTSLLESSNDLFLVDEPREKRVSREHFQIERESDGTYTLTDRGSTCGTVVGNRMVGGARRSGQCPLADGNVVIVGGPDSPYVFQFLENGTAAPAGDVTPE